MLSKRSICKENELKARLASIGSEGIGSRGMVYLEDFGQVGVDDTALLLEAIEEITKYGNYSDRYTKSGGIIQLLDKTYEFDYMPIKANVQIIGSGRRTTIKKTANSSYSSLVNMYHYGVNAGHDWYAGGFKLANLTLDGDKDSYLVDCKINTTADTIAKSDDSAHGLHKDTPIKFTASKTPGGLELGLTYYIIDATETTFKLSLTVDGSAINLTSTGTSVRYSTYISDAIYLSAPNGYFEWNEDPYLIIENVFIENFTGKGIYVPSVENQKVQGCTYKSIIIRNCLDDGMQINSSDNNGFDITVAGCHSGIVLNGGNNNLSVIKTYYNTDTGMILEESCTGTKISGYETQEEYKTGLHFIDCNNVSVEGFVSESHGHDNGANNGLGVGLILDNCNHCNISGKINNRNQLAGSIQYATKYLNDPRFNKVDVSVNGPGGANLSKPIEFFYDTLPPITNSLRINGIDRHLPNILAKCQRVIGDNNSGGQVDGLICDNQYNDETQIGMIASFSYDLTEQCQKFNVTDCSDISKVSLGYIEIPAKEGEVLSVAMEGKCDLGLSFKVGVNTYSGTPSSSSYKDNTSGNTIKPTSEKGSMWDWTIISKYVIPNASPDVTYIRIQFQVIANATGVQDLNAWLRNIIVTKENERNEKLIWKWGASPSGEFVPLYLGQQFLDTVGGKIYTGIGFENNSWV